MHKGQKGKQLSPSAQQKLTGCETANRLDVIYRACLTSSRVQSVHEQITTKYLRGENTTAQRERERERERDLEYLEYTNYTSARIHTCQLGVKIVNRFDQFLLRIRNKVKAFNQVIPERGPTIVVNPGCVHFNDKIDICIHIR